MKKTIFIALIAISLVLSGCLPKTPTEKQTGTSGQLTGPTTDWQVYNNSEYGFKIKYPSDWVFETTVIGDPEAQKVIKLLISFSDKIHKLSHEAGEITALASLEVSQGTLEEYRKFHNAPVPGSIKEMTINTYPAIQEKSGQDDVVYIIELPEVEYRITLTDHTSMFSKQISNDEKDELKNTVDNIFSTFEFVD